MMHNRRQAVDVIQVIMQYAGNPFMSPAVKWEISRRATMWQIRMKQSCVRYLSYCKLRSGAFHVIKVIETGDNIMFTTKYHNKTYVYSYTLIMAEYN